MAYGYPPNHRDTSEPQPEVCDLCARRVSAFRLRTTPIHGLRGYRICDEHEWRDMPTKREVDQIHPGVPGAKLIGNSRVLPPGDEPWWFTRHQLRLLDGEPELLKISARFHLRI